jgi:SpoVK/Ycf46/Vps4 family AAA+-type ATPase
MSELEIAVAADPNRRSLRLSLACACIDEGHPDLALVQVRTILTSRPGDVEALGIGAMAAALSGDTLSSDAFAGALILAQRQSDNEAAPVSMNADESAGSMETLPSAASPISGIEVVVPVLSLTDFDGGFAEKHRLEQVLVQPFRFRKQPKVNGVTRDTRDQVIAALPSGVLLYGPKNVGKSYMAHALAGEMNTNVVALDLGRIADPWGAPSVGVITEAFRLAEYHAPCLVFLDNVEVISHRRLRYLPDGRERLAELEAALDAHDPSKIAVVGSTSMPWMIPASLRRKGRFDHLVLMGPPDIEARTSTLFRYFRQRMLPVEADLREFAMKAEGCTNHDLHAIGAVAAALALAASVEGRGLRAVGNAELTQALSVLPKSGFDWFDTAYNFPEFTDDSSEFDPMYDYIRRHIRRVG